MEAMRTAGDQRNAWQRVADALAEVEEAKLSLQRAEDRYVEAVIALGEQWSEDT